MDKWKEYLVLLLSFLCGTGLTYLSKVFGGIEKIVFFICILIIAALAGIIAYQKRRDNKTTRFAIIVFLLDYKDDMILVMNKTHHIWLPPCKTMKTNEMPHQAVERILRDQVGLAPSDYFIDTRVHTLTGEFDRVFDCYTPYAAQQEFVTKQSQNVQYHYSLIYVYKLKPNVELNRATDFFPNVYSLEKINAIEDRIKPFRDIIQRYEILLEHLRNENSTYTNEGDVIK